VRISGSHDIDRVYGGHLCVIPCSLVKVHGCIRGYYSSVRKQHDQPKYRLQTTNRMIAFKSVRLCNIISCYLVVYIRRKTGRHVHKNSSVSSNFGSTYILTSRHNNSQ